MPTLTLKGLPDHLYETLKSRAAANRRSQTNEVIQRLAHSVAVEPVDVSARLARIDALRERIRAEMEARGAQPMTPEEIRAAINEGRP